MLTRCKNKKATASDIYDHPVKHILQEKI